MHFGHLIPPPPPLISLNIRARHPTGSPKAHSLLAVVGGAELDETLLNECSGQFAKLEQARAADARDALCANPAS